MYPMPATPQPLEYEDIQGNILRPSAMDFARYLFLTFHSASRAKAWLQALQPLVTDARDWGKTPPPYTLNLAFSYQGLFALNIPRELLESFPESFQLGMRSRATVLGDLG
ncbi:MAG TPA: hypothetical protein VLQ93_01345, partial [Myxococcaceae bacterium]|nr:hypothetical protein [Myxococcaceae bacterium]